MSILGENNVAEYAVPDRSGIWDQIGDRIASRMQFNGTLNNNNQITIPVSIGGKHLFTEISEATRNGQIVIHPRSLAKG